MPYRRASQFEDYVLLDNARQAGVKLKNEIFEDASRMLFEAFPGRTVVKIIQLLQV